MKGATWFDCSVDQIHNVNPCKAWDSSGRLIAFGNYRLDNEGRAATARELRLSIVHNYPDHPDLAWIYLSTDKGGDFGKTLVPVGADGRPLERFEVRIGGVDP
jgi:hypothetical protein